MLKTVYDPVTNEPFEVPENRATKLVLEKGWNQTPHDPEAERAVTAAPKAVEASVEVSQARGKKASPVVHDAEPVEENWRGSEDEGEVEDA